jgi:endonuclease YncB( thermonuclease family)
MKRTWINAALLVAVFLAIRSSAVFAGDTIYGKVVSVAANAQVVIFQSHGETRHKVQIVGIQVDPHRPALAAQAKKFVENLVRGKYVRLRIVRRVKDQLIGKLLVEDPADGIQDVGIRMLEEGYAKRLREFDYVYKYGESIAAEKVGKTKHHGI